MTQGAGCACGGSWVLMRDPVPQAVTARAVELLSYARQNGIPLGETWDEETLPGQCFHFLHEEHPPDAQNPQPHDGITVYACSANVQPAPPAPNYPNTQDLSDAFFADLVSVGKSLSIDPLDMLGVMLFESDVRASAQNPSSKATGLIQFMPGTLSGLGWTSGPDSFRQVSAENQVPWVERYFAPYARAGLSSVGRVYQAVFLPASLVYAKNAGDVVAAASGPYSAAYESNKVFDPAGKGSITVQDLTDAVGRAKAAHAARWAEIVARVGKAAAPVVGGKAPSSSSSSPLAPPPPPSGFTADDDPCDDGEDGTS